jgi:glyoxylase-like metal-dependent hydrolase (beta-lactamase superfamily II)/rhodanese-related sulfurtransferase
MIEIVTIETPSLGDRSYLATDGRVAVVIDPQRDFDRVLAVADQRGVRITDVFETHIHNDYVTGGLALAAQAGARYHVNAADQVSFQRTPVRDDELVEAGSMSVRAIGTPGHTFTHLSYALADGDRVIAAFTGGSLLIGSTGRTDLLGQAHQEELARAQYRSARRLTGELPPEAQLCPTHGFGSFCAATPATGSSSTIADQQRANPVLTMDEAGYVEHLLAGLDAYPAYYAHMSAANAAGPAAPDLSPPCPADPVELRGRIDAGEWVVDLRSRTAFAAGHLRGTLHFELGDNLATYLGWLIPWGMPLTLLAATAEDLSAAQRQLARIGIDRPGAGAIGSPPPGAIDSPPPWAGGEPLRSYPVADYKAVEAARGGPGPMILLDVRRDPEWRAERIEGARHIPLHELAGRISEIPSGRIWVHCQGGYRASVAASILDAAGRDVVLIDDDFGCALQSGLAAGARG